MELMNMIIYDGLKSDFLKSVEEDTIAIEIQRNILERMAGTPLTTSFGHG